MLSVLLLRLHKNIFHILPAQPFVILESSVFSSLRFRHNFLYPSIYEFYWMWIWIYGKEPGRSSPHQQEGGGGMGGGGMGGGLNHPTNKRRRWREVNLGPIPPGRAYRMHPGPAPPQGKDTLNQKGEESRAHKANRGWVLQSGPKRGGTGPKPCTLRIIEGL